MTEKSNLENQEIESEISNNETSESKTKTTMDDIKYKATTLYLDASKLKNASKEEQLNFVNNQADEVTEIISNKIDSFFEKLFHKKKKR